MFVNRRLLLACLLWVSLCSWARGEDDVSGPVVKLSDVQVSGQSKNLGDVVNASATPPEDNPGIVEMVQETAKEVAREVDKTLIKVKGAIVDSGIRLMPPP